MSFLKNDNCVISTANVSEDSDFFFRNSYAHELIFVHHGKGEFLSEYGQLIGFFTDAPSFDLTTFERSAEYFVEISPGPKSINVSKFKLLFK